MVNWPSLRVVATEGGGGNSAPPILVTPVRGAAPIRTPGTNGTRLMLEDPGPEETNSLLPDAGLVPIIRASGVGDCAAIAIVVIVGDSLGS